jgi:hypothetical protein
MNFEATKAFTLRLSAKCGPRCSHTMACCSTGRQPSARPAITASPAPMVSPGQRQVFAQMARAAAQEVAAAHVREQADVGLGHGHLGALGHDAQAAALADAHAAAHDDAVHEGDVGLGVVVDQVVERVFLGEEVFQRGLPASAAWWKKRMSPPAQKGAERALLVAAPDRHGQHPGRRRQASSAPSGPAPCPATAHSAPGAGSA